MTFNCFLNGHLVSKVLTASLLRVGFFFGELRIVYVMSHVCYTVYTIFVNDSAIDSVIFGHVSQLNSFLMQKQQQQWNT